jgi:hypothetical protein
MEKNLKFLLLVLAGPSLLIFGCTKDCLHDRTTKTTFTLNTTMVVSETRETGYYFASGDPTTSGTYEMDITVVGDSLHCSQILFSKEGTITIRSDCSLNTMAGKWYVTHGTRAYSNLEGNGTLIMEFPANGPSVEALAGETWRR